MPALRNPRVAVVDDSLAVRESLRLLLGIRGYRVDAFSGASDLLASMGLSAFDCFVIDLKLDGLDGTQLLATVRSRGFHQPAILISGWQVESLARIAFEAGFASQVCKPMLVTSIVDAISHILGAGRPKPSEA